MAPPLTFIFLVRDVEQVHHQHRHGGEGFVELIDVDVADFHAGFLQRLAGHGVGPVSMMPGSDPMEAMARCARAA